MLKEKYVHKAIQKQNINLFVLVMISFTCYWPRSVKNILLILLQVYICCPPYID